MALNLLLCALFSLLLSAFPIAIAGDPDILNDFHDIRRSLDDIIDGRNFTYSGMRPLFDSSRREPETFTVTTASLLEFNLLYGQSVSFAALQFPPGAANPPHTHPRASELLLLVDGELEVGFVGTNNDTLYAQTLQAGYMFLFPKGLVHFQFNSGKGDAFAISSFGSARPGVVPMPSAVFASGIDEGILAKSFKTDVATIEKIKAGLAPPKAY